MAAFSYKALDADGKLLKGIMDGDSERQVRNLLRSRDLKPVEVNQAGMRVEASVNRPLFSRAISQADLALFTRQLATLVLSGVPLDEALSATASQSRKTGVKSLVLQVRNNVVSGHSLGASLRDFPRSFDEMYCAMVRAGESAGYLGRVLEQLADYIENRQYVRHKLKMAMVYPLALMGVAIAVIFLLMIFVMPELISLFDHTDTRMPWLTQVLISTSGFLAAYWWLVLALLAAIFVTTGKLLALDSVRAARDALLLRMPVISHFVTTIETERFSSTLSILVSSGVPLLDGIRIAGAVMGNIHLREACRDVALAVQEGEPLYRAMDQAGVFPPMLVQMVASGESSGNLESMLERSARNQARELETTLNAILGIMEPLIIVVMATIVGAIVMAVLLPIMQMNTLVG